MAKPKSQFKMFAKTIALMLIFSILANILNILTYAKPAKAVDASDHMILFWPSTNCADTPSGWTALSDGAGEDFNAYFPRGAASYSAKAGGASSHTHTITSVTTTGIASSSGDRNAGSGVTGANNTHTHTGNTASIGAAVTALPKYGEMCVIQYDNGIPTSDTAIPNGAVAIFDAAVPAGWNDYSSTFSAASDTFIRGGTNGTGGNNNHGGTGHSITNITLGAVSGTVTGQSSTKSLSSTTHTHPASTATSNTPDTQPSYMNIYLGQKSSAGPIPNGMIAMFDDADSSVGFSVAGWTRLSDGGGPFNNRFLKVTGSYGTPGGNTNHTHTTTATSNSGGDDSNTGKAGTGGPIMSHTHSLSIGLSADANTNIPPYTDVVIAKKQTDITSLTTDQVAYPGHGDTITVDSTVNNYHASTNLANTKIDYVIFEDTGTADGRPTPGETYVTNNCAGSGAWNAGPPGNYTHQTTGVNVAFGGSTNDQWQCANTNFPDNTTYTLWARWWDGTSYAYNIYKDKGSVTFTSVPTLTEILFMALVGCMVFLGVKQGVIKINMPNNKKGKKCPPDS